MDDSAVQSRPLLRLHGVTKHFAGVPALKGVDLDLRSGEILALLGENGAGKSTLMKVLAGVHRPDAGRILLDGRHVEFASPRDARKHGISIIYQEFSLVPHLSTWENIFFGREKRTPWGALNRSAMRADSRALLQRLGVQFDIDVPVTSLSVAQRQFVEIAKALALSARILILDEPTATLTTADVEHLFRVMRELRNSGVAMIFISHHLDEIFQIADRVQCLRDGASVGLKPISECTPRELVRMIAGRDITQTFPPRSKTVGPVILDVHSLRRRKHLPEVKFDLKQGEILGVAGLVGSGRTETMRALIGADKTHSRSVTFKGRPFAPATPADSRALGIGLLPEDRKQQGVILPFALSENLVLTNLATLCHPVTHWLRRDRIDTVVRDFMQRLRIRASSPRQPLRTLSGGNQQKVVIAKWLHADCALLIFDEPTRGIDVGARYEIYELMRDLANRGVAIIMISSDLPEIVGMSDRVIVMRQQRIEKTFERAEDISAESILFYATGGHTV
jgi:ribose transport system ATP-binding protein